MKIQLLIAVSEGDYAEHLSRVLAEKNADLFEISVCSDMNLLSDCLGKRRFDAALLDIQMAMAADLSVIRLPLLLWDGSEEVPESVQGIPRLRKYQRISAISVDVVQQYISVSGSKEGFDSARAFVTAVWSPAGGCGKTTVALAFAAYKAASGKRVVYLNLEPFAATPVYFKDPGKSISMVFEKLDGDVELLLQSIRQEDISSGICYFGRPQNYDDMNILTDSDIAALLDGCSASADDLVIDLGNQCTKQVQQVLEAANQVLLVTDSSAVCRSKCDQFRKQHNIYTELSDKLIVVANRGARNVAAEGETVLYLPKVNSEDPAVVYQTLSGHIQEPSKGGNRL